MRGRIEVVVATVVAVVACACAEGFVGDGEASGSTLTPSVAGNQAPAPPASGTGADPSQAGTGAYMGDPCAMNETETCTCDDGGEGTRVCLFDEDSPTGGSFSECRACTQPEPPDAGTSDADASASGGGGSGGAGGSGGSGGTGGTGSSTPPASSASGAAPWCIFVPIPLPGLC